jgi:hypothetical protein
MGDRVQPGWTVETFSAGVPPYNLRSYRVTNP